jgi:hypothetical protein
VKERVGDESELSVECKKWVKEKMNVREREGVWGSEREEETGKSKLWNGRKEVGEKGKNTSESERGLHLFSKIFDFFCLLVVQK